MFLQYTENGNGISTGKSAGEQTHMSLMTACATLYLPFRGHEPRNSVRSGLLDSGSGGEYLVTLSDPVWTGLQSPCQIIPAAARGKLLEPLV